MIPKYDSLSEKNYNFIFFENLQVAGGPGKPYHYQSLKELKDS